jgi:hypothetical protein
VESALNRFRGQITRVEVTITDENAMKHGSTDKRCLMETRAMGFQPVAVSYQAATIGDAVIGAARKLRAALGRSLGNRIGFKGGPLNPQDVSGWQWSGDGPLDGKAKRINRRQGERLNRR